MIRRAPIHADMRGIRLDETRCTSNDNSMSWQLRHEGSPEALGGLTLQQIVDGLRDGQWETTDEIKADSETEWRTIESHPALADVAEDLATPPPVRHEEPTSLDMNALIDVCLVLLIFFMITTAYAAIVQKSVPLAMTKADTKGIRVVRVDQVKSKMIRVQAYHDKADQPVVRVEGQTLSGVLTADGKIDADKLRDALRPYVKGEDHKQEVLLDARDITWENVIRIQDGARAAGIQAVHHLLPKSAN
jgi:biopolymer transport protein ExbD